MKIYFLSQESLETGFTDEKGEFLPLPPSEVALVGNSSREENQNGEECFLGAEKFCHVWPWPRPRYLVNLPGVTSLVPLGLVVLLIL